MAKVLALLNSSFVLLDANETFIGIVEKVSIYESVIITIKSDVSSADNGVSIYMGSSPTTLINKFNYTYEANENKTISLKLSDAYFKIEYTNTNSNQTSFSLQVFYSYIISDNFITYSPNQYDLFGNIKVSNSYTLLDIAHIYDNNPLNMDEYVSGGSSTYDANNASVLMSVSANNHKVIRQSRLYTAYQPGKSLCVRMTGVLNANSNASTTISRIGYFDENNGLFFEYSNGIYRIVERKNTNDDNFITRSNWNIDSLDGTGPSGLNVDFTKNFIYYIELAYLGVGLVKMGVVYNGSLYVAHIFKHNTIQYPYIVSPNLPIRWELSSTGGSGQLICTCGSVQSEGGYNLIGSPFGMGMTTAFSIDADTSTQQYVMSIRLKPTNRKIVKFVSLSILCTSGSSAIYSLYRFKSPSTNPVVFNPAVIPNPPAPTFNNITNSVIQYHFNSSTAGGTPISNYTVDTSTADLLYRNYFTANESLNLSNLTDIGGPIYLTAGINVTNDTNGFKSDYLVLTVQQLSNQDETFYGSFNWIEV